jgi:hypothetical protein
MKCAMFKVYVIGNFKDARFLIKVGEKNIQVIQILIVNMKCAMFKVYVIGNFKDATQITINTFKHEMLPT